MVIPDHDGHERCADYEVSGSPTIEFIQFEKDETITQELTRNQLIFMISGSYRIFSDLFPELDLEKDQGIFLPLGSHYKAIALKEVRAAFINLDFREFLYPLPRFDHVSPSPSVETKTGILYLKPLVREYLTSLSLFWIDGLRSPIYCELKIKELLFLLGHYYSNEELGEFFHYCNNEDIRLMSLICLNWKKVRSAQELASLANYSVSGFNKKFKKIFRQTPYQWLNERKKNLIYEDMVTTNMSFKELSEKYMFNSVQQLNYYCRKNFDKTPTQIRHPK